jgi:hypothetical protein
VNEFASHVERHRRELLLHCYRMLGSLPDAEDAVQERLLRAWRYRDSVKESAPLRPWLYRVATNERLPRKYVCGVVPSIVRNISMKALYTVVTDCDSDLRDRFLLCQHLKGSKQPRLLSPTAK